MSAVLLSASAPPVDLRELIAQASFPVIDHVLGAIPPLDFREIGVALIEVGERQDAAAAQTRRWRAELGDDLVPIVWVLPALDGRSVARGLDAGADAVLTRPLDAAVLLAQLRSAVRTRICSARLTARVAESRILGEHLKKAHAEADRSAAALRRVRLAFLERSFPKYGPVRIFVSHRPRGQAGGDFYEVSQVGDGRIAIAVGDVIGPGAAHGLIGHLAARIAARSLNQSVQSPGSVLAGINRELLEIGLEDLPLLAMIIAIINPVTSVLEIARAGLPAPVHLPAAGAGEWWPIPGPFLGTGETAYATHSAVLKPGDRLLIGTDGIRPDGNPEPTSSDLLLECGESNRELQGQSFTDAVARKLLSNVRHEEDFTLLVLETAR